MARKVNRDAVIKRTSASRADRAAVSPKRVPKEVTDDERVEMLRQSMFQSSLPDLPKIPGYHTCWLTTANPRDPIVRREQIGYTLIKATELPGWEYSASKGGSYDGCIMINEMIAAKITTSLFERFMSNNHHEEPLFQEEQLVRKTQEKVEEAASYGGQLIPSPAMVELGKDPGLTATFSSAYGED